jgi:N,N'-diacetyllegionaminate synthase
MSVKTRVFIIAEAGVNHNGCLDMALQLVDVAADAGANAVKFQTFSADALVTKAARQADYQVENTGKTESQYEMLKRLELSENDHLAIIERCKQRQIQFLSTPFDSDSIVLLHKLGMTTYKVPSGELTNLPYLRQVASVAQQVILSTGMARLAEVEDALIALLQAGLSREQIIVLHATTEYPCPMNEVNLRAMQTLAQAFGVAVGYSDHTKGIEVPVAAVALGATVIEKHFTLDNRLPGPDHKASLEPLELKAMVSAIRNVEQALGDGIKQPTASEQKNMSVARKSIVASKVIKIGDLFTADNLTVKRPGTGISPMRWDEVIGQTSHYTFIPDEPIAL